MTKFCLGQKNILHRILKLKTYKKPREYRETNAICYQKFSCTFQKILAHSKEFPLIQKLKKNIRQMLLGFSESVWHSEWPIRLDMYWVHTYIYILCGSIVFFAVFSSFGKCLHQVLDLNKYRSTHLICPSWTGPSWRAPWQQGTNSLNLA